VPQPVASFKDPRTNILVLVYPRKGERAQHAIERVMKRHGMPASKKKGR
jgi:hypothetical protein